MAEGPKIIIGINPDDEDTYLVHLEEPAFTARLVKEHESLPSGLSVAMSDDWVLEGFRAADPDEIHTALTPDFLAELDDAIKTVLSPADE